MPVGNPSNDTAAYTFTFDQTYASSATYPVYVPVEARVYAPPAPQELSNLEWLHSQIDEIRTLAREL